MSTRGEIIHRYPDDRYCVHIVEDTGTVTDRVVTLKEAADHASAWNEIVRQIVEHLTTGAVSAT